MQHCVRPCAVLSHLTMSINRDFMFAWMGEWTPLSGDATLDNPAEAREQDDIKYMEPCQVLWNNCNVQTHWMSQTDPCLSVSVTITDDHAHTELFLKWDTLKKMMWCAWKMEVLLLFPTSFMFCTWQTCMLLCHVHKTCLVTYRNSLMYWIITEIVRCIHW